MTDPESGRQDALSGQQPRSYDYNYQAGYQQEAERQRIQSGWDKIHNQTQPAWSAAPSGGGSLSANFLLLESLVVGGLTALILWQVHPVLGILGFFAGMIGFMLLFAIPVVKQVLSVVLSGWYGLIGWNYASRRHLDIIWHLFIALSVFGVSYFMHRKVAGTMSIRRNNKRKQP